jgi:arylsulfatase A-like enzyme
MNLKADPKLTSKKATRRKLLQGAAAAAASTFASRGAFANGTTRRTRPNIVFILADDLGWADLSVYGRPDYKTPVLDKLAGRGVRLTQAYSNSSVCTPTRIAFLTGRYQQRLPVGLQEPLGNSRNAPPGGYPGLPPEHPTIASLLNNSGYRTALIGKWHAGYLPTFGPTRSGFDEFFGIFSGGVDYFTHRDGSGDLDLWEQETQVARVGYITDLISERATDYIKKRARKSEPFYLSLHYTAPHWPWEGPEDEAVSRNLRSLTHLDGGSLAVFARMVQRLDEGIGRVLRTLESTGLDDNTIVVFTSDNGGERFSNIWPFLGSKGGVYEGSNRVPAIVWWPKKLPENEVSQQVAITFDWTATLLAAAQVEPDPRYPLDGINLLPYLKHNRTVSRDLFWRIRGQRAVRSGDLKYLSVPSAVQVAAQGFPATALGTEFLFDLATDVRERANLLTQRPADAARLRQLWDSWNAGVLPEPAVG